MRYTTTTKLVAAIKTRRCWNFILPSCCHRHKGFSKLPGIERQNMYLQVPTSIINMYWFWSSESQSSWISSSFGKSWLARTRPTAVPSTGWPRVDSQHNITLSQR
jgi:hypothetical protein